MEKAAVEVMSTQPNLEATTELEQQGTIVARVEKDECNFCELPFEQNELRMCCHQCKDFSLCMDCYKAGAEYKSHRRSHQMYQRCEYDIVAWPDGFTIEDDLLLLEAIELHGIGSWDAIRLFMKRPPGEPVEVVVKHWALVYSKSGILYGDTLAVCLPNVRLYETFQTLRDFESKLENLEKLSAIEIFSRYYQSQRMPNVVQFQMLNATPQQFQGWNNNFIEKLLSCPLELLMDPEAQVMPPFMYLNEIPSNTGEGTGQEFVLGSWPYREEFTYELCNKAEYPIMYMHFSPKIDTPQSLTAKVRVLECYANRLVQRHRRKRFLYQYSLHRQDRRIDDVSIAAETSVLRRLGRTPEIPNLSHINVDDAVCRYEADNPELLRGFPTRMDFRNFASSVINERSLREAIFRLQIARILGFRQMARMTEVVNFLKNPDTPEEDRKHFPVGTVHFETFDQQRYTLDNATYEEEFKLEQPGVETAQHPGQKPNEELNLSKLEIAVDAAIRDRVVYEGTAPLNCAEMNLREKIFALMRTNFRLPANDIQSYTAESCAKALREIKITSFADLKGAHLKDMLIFVKSLGNPNFRGNCACGGCFYQNHACGRRCFAAYYESLVKYYKIVETKFLEHNLIFKEFGGVLSCGCRGMHHYGCLYLSLDVIELSSNLQEAESEQAEGGEFILRGEELGPAFVNQNSTIKVEEQLSAVDLCASPYGQSETTTTEEEVIAEYYDTTPLQVEKLDPVEEASIAMKQIVLPETDEFDILGRNYSERNEKVTIRTLEFGSPEFSIETIPQEQLDSQLSKEFNEASCSDEVHKTVELPEFSNEVEFDVFKPFLHYFFEESVVPHYASLKNVDDVIKTLRETGEVPFYNSINQMLYLNRAMDLILHMTEYTKHQTAYQVLYQRSSSLATPLVAELMISLYFLCAMTSLTSSLFSAFQNGGKHNLSFNNTHLSDEQLLLVLLQTFQGLTYLPKCKDFSVVAHFMTEYAKVMLATLSLDENLFSTEEVVTTALNPENQEFIQACLKLFGDSTLEDDMQELLQQNHSDVTLIVEQFCRRINAGGAAMKQAIIHKASELSDHTVESSVSQTPASLQQLTPETHALHLETFHTIFASAAIELVWEETYSPASCHISRTILLESIFAFGINSTQYMTSLVNEISRRRCEILEKSELTATVLTGLEQQMESFPHISCQSTEYTRPETSLFLGCYTPHIKNCNVPRLLTFGQCAALNYLLQLPATSPIYLKKEPSQSKQQMRYSTESLGEILTSPETVLRMSRDDYMEQRIRLFQNSKSVILHYLSETKLRNILLVLSSIVSAVELELNIISERETTILRLLNDSFPSDEVNANASAIDRNLGDFLFVLPKSEARNLECLPIKRNQYNIISLLKQENIEYEDYVCVESIDFLFGPRIEHNGADDPFAVIPLNENLRKLKENKTEYNKQKSSDFQLSTEYLERYLTRGELVLCCLARISVENYLEAKISFVSNGYIITNHILAALDWRLGIAEAMAFLCLAQYNEADSSTLPRIQDTDGCFSAYDWSFCTPGRIFAFNEVIGEKEFETAVSGKSYKVKDVITDIEFKYRGNAIQEYEKLSVISCQITPFCQQLFAVPAGLLFKSTETQSIEAADKLSEKLNQIILKSRIFQDFSEAARGAEGENVHYKRLPDEGTETDRSFYRDAKEDYLLDIEEILKQRRSQRSQLLNSNRVFVQKINLNAPQIWQFHSYGTHDDALHSCFEGNSSVAQFPVTEFEKICPFLMQHLKDNMRRK